MFDFSTIPGLSVRSSLALTTVSQVVLTVTISGLKFSSYPQDSLLVGGLKTAQLINEVWQRNIASSTPFIKKNRLLRYAMHPSLAIAGKGFGFIGLSSIDLLLSSISSIIIGVGAIRDMASEISLAQKVHSYIGALTALQSTEINPVSDQGSILKPLMIDLEKWQGWTNDKTRSDLFAKLANLLDKGGINADSLQQMITSLERVAPSQLQSCYHISEDLVTSLGGLFLGYHLFLYSLFLAGKYYDRTRWLPSSPNQNIPAWTFLLSKENPEPSYSSTIAQAKESGEKPLGDFQKDLENILNKAQESLRRLVEENENGHNGSPEAEKSHLDQTAQKFQTDSKARESLEEKQRIELENHSRNINQMLEQIKEEEWQSSIKELQNCLSFETPVPSEGLPSYLKIIMEENQKSQRKHCTNVAQTILKRLLPGFDSGNYASKGCKYLNKEIKKNGKDLLKNQQNHFAIRNAQDFLCPKPRKILHNEENLDGMHEWTPMLS